MTGPATEQTPLDDGGPGKRAGRIALEVPVRLRSSQGLHAGMTTNVCSGGLFVATSRSLPAGERVTVVLVIPGDPEPAEAAAEVRWSRRSDEVSDRPAGLGLRFVDTTLRATMLVAELHRARRPRKP